MKMGSGSWEEKGNDIESLEEVARELHSAELREPVLCIKCPRREQYVPINGHCYRRVLASGDNQWTIEYCPSALEIFKGAYGTEGVICTYQKKNRK
jgi:hypothetical protein